MSRTSIPYEKYLMECLQDPAEVAAYRMAAIEDGDPALIALVESDIKKAQAKPQCVQDQERHAAGECVAPCGFCWEDEQERLSAIPPIFHPSDTV